MLAKIGDEIYVNPQEESISFRTVNMAKSAYSDFTFHKNFFSYYTLGDLEEEEAHKCKISMRVISVSIAFTYTMFNVQFTECNDSLQISTYVGQASGDLPHSFGGRCLQSSVHFKIQKWYHQISPDAHFGF